MTTRKRARPMRPLAGRLQSSAGGRAHRSVPIGAIRCKTLASGYNF